MALILVPAVVNVGFTSPAYVCGWEGGAVSMVLGRRPNLPSSPEVKSSFSLA